MSTVDPRARSAKTTRTAEDFDHVVSILPGFKVFTRHPATREERDNPGNIFGVRSYGDAFREISSRLARHERL
jgi:hypothetical protein